MSYSFGSEHYSFNNEAVKYCIQNSVKRVIKPLKGKYEKMLDMGCGTGENTIFMGEYFHANNIIGVDKNESYINYAGKNNTFNSRAKYEVCDLNEENILQSILRKNEDIDLVVSGLVLHWVDNPLNIFKTLSASLRNGTVEHVHIILKQCFQPLVNICSNIPNHPKWKNYLKDAKDIPQCMKKEEPIFPSNDFRQKLSNMNYEICTERVISMSHRFESYENTIECIRWLLPLTKYIPSDLQDEFLQDCWTEFTKNWSFDEEFFVKVDVYVLHMKHG